MQRIDDDVGDNASPTGVNDGKCAGGSNQDNRDAVGEAEQGSHIRAGDDNRIGTARHALLRFDQVGRNRCPNRFDMRPVNLIRNEERNALATKRPHDLTTILHHIVKHIVDMGAKVQRRIRPFAHPARAPGEGNANTEGFEQGVIGEHGYATRAEKARVKGRFS